MLPLRAAPFRAIRATPSLVTRLSPAARFYHDKDMGKPSLFTSRPRNPGSLDKSDPSVGTGLVGAPACGDVMKLQIKVDDKTGTITDAKFKTFGCGSAIASSSYLTTLVKGMRRNGRGLQDSQRRYLKGAVSPSLHCSMLAEDAIRAAIADYQGKNPNSISNLAGTARTLDKEAATA
ncbi:hypothetical protein L249_8295 [Ophiocordyceps polyrhachis-furcata BCC 54312]|uniref:NIF system FeS cluster assembly NifU N-terminal domain-containing protein n=1 Tax=Ophiocordyceps polyrhachis-furcata BCC 54312 TaxID=1330021 RepID=A0A367LHY5_9HYPO|nr:hypothetical protein L249_8295 [Ophiocordyceps polyrhachis-furcata BCC 54312]